MKIPKISYIRLTSYGSIYRIRFTRYFRRRLGRSLFSYLTSAILSPNVNRWFGIQSIARRGREIEIERRGSATQGACSTDRRIEICWSSTTFKIRIYHGYSFRGGLDSPGLSQIYGNFLSQRRIQRGGQVI